MAFETNDFIEVSNIMLQIYDTMESEMLSKFSTRLSMNAKQGVANAYHDLQAHRIELQKIVERYTEDLDESYKDMIARAFVSGVAGADIDLGGQSEAVSQKNVRDCSGRGGSPGCQLVRRHHASFKIG